MEYTKSQILRVAKRHNNQKRHYILVNPLQAKHIPVSPSVSLEMMRSLGKKLREKHGGARLVIAFAETATAIGAVAADTLAPDCVFLPTTRERFGGKWIEFLEEHSHAVEQRLFVENLAKHIAETGEIILLDDEFSTGKTLLNMVNKLRANFNELSEKKIIAASIINRLSEENEARLNAAGIQTEYLLKFEETIDEEKIRALKSYEADIPSVNAYVSVRRITLDSLPNPRKGILINGYKNACLQAYEKLFASSALEKELETAHNILVLGAEECMYPALLLGEKIEKRFQNAEVFCHATTRSPIAVAEEENYPIRNGFRLQSLYDEERTTYIYNLKKYDAALIVTDSKNVSEKAITTLKSALFAHGTQNIFLLEAGHER